MKLSALSIGTAAVYGKSNFSDLSELFPPPATDLFWLHLIQSWISLSMAADRLRTFFIEFVLCESEKRLDKKLKKTYPTEGGQFFYIQAFYELSAKRLPTGESPQHLSELQGLLECIANIRSRRNKFVHEYASREAMIIAAQRDGRSDHVGANKALKGDKHTGDFIEELADAYRYWSEEAI